MSEPAAEALPGLALRWVLPVSGSALSVHGVQDVPKQAICIN